MTDEVNEYRSLNSIAGDLLREARDIGRIGKRTMKTVSEAEETPDELELVEDVEPIDELSPATLGSYIGKATSAATSAAYMSATAAARRNRKFRDDKAKRVQGIGAAVRSLQTKIATKEEVEPIDELSPAMKLVNYRDRARGDLTDKLSGKPKDSNFFDVRNRRKGIKAATKRINAREADHTVLLAQLLSKRIDESPGKEKPEGDWKVRMHKDRSGRGMFTHLIVKAKSAEEARVIAAKQSEGGDYPYTSHAKRHVKEEAEIDEGKILDGIRQKLADRSKKKSVDKAVKAGAKFAGHQKQHRQEEVEVVDEIKGWKNAHSDLMKHRSAQAHAGDSVKLVSLKKDGTESKMHDAAKTFKSEDEARAHHKRITELNPTRKIAHNLYVGGEHKGKLGEDAIDELDEGRGRPKKDGAEADEGDHHIVMQLRKNIALRGAKPVTFADKTKVYVHPSAAHRALEAHNSLRTPVEKEHFASMLHASHKSFRKALGA